MIKERKSSGTKKIVVIGTSAGGRDALIKLLSQLPKNFAAPLLIVQHLSPDGFPNALLKTLNERSHIECELAVDGKKVKKGFGYIAPPDHHLFVTSEGKILLTKGATENRSRPAIDPLFRSAAINYGSNVIAVLLTGYLDDGTSGLIAVNRCGGTTIIQDPADATYPDMPLNALHQVRPDYCVPIIEMGAILAACIAQPQKKQHAIPKDIQKEAIIAQRVLSDLPTVNELGDQAPFNCPGCGGVLWKMDKEKGLRYRCHVGHAYTAISLLSEQNKKVEETMWTALRMFEERRNLLITLSSEQTGATARLTKERADISQVHIDRIRTILQADDMITPISLSAS
jgi:two-component system chemotaxis response regulator CheB